MTFECHWIGFADLQKVVDKIRTCGQMKILVTYPIFNSCCTTLEHGGSSITMFYLHFKISISSPRSWLFLTDSFEYQIHNIQREKQRSRSKGESLPLGKTCKYKFEHKHLSQLLGKLNFNLIMATYNYIISRIIKERF